MKTHRPPRGPRRRDFLKQTLLGAAGLAVPLVVPARALGRDGAVAPSERIVLAGIGLGPRGQYDLSVMLPESDVQFVAICDVQRSRREQVKRLADAHYGNKDCALYRDFRELLARADIDAILIATGDHWHALGSLLAARAGKDVYSEKPCGLTMGEIQTLADGIHRYGRVYQAGTQRRSIGNFQYAIHLAHSGKLGRLHTLHASVYVPSKNYTWLASEPEPPPQECDWDLWLGPAPWRPYNSRYVAGGWRGHHDFEAAGNFPDWGAHTVDLCQWANQADNTTPIEYEATPNSIIARYANGVKLICDFLPTPFGDRSPQYKTSTGTCPVRFEGDEGWVETGDNSEIVLSPNLAKSLGRQFAGTGLSSAGHGRNFFDCVKSRTRTVCNQDIMRRSHLACFAAQLSWQLGRKLAFDPVKEEFVGDEEANRMRHRAAREPWSFVMSWICGLLMAAAAGVPLCSNASAVEAAGKTKSLIAVLQSDASLYEKARACQQLGEIGSAEAVPALSALLSDSHLNAYARSGLEGIPDPSAAAVLRDAAEKLKGPLLVGVVNSLGALRDAQAVGLLSRLAADPASGCAPAALLALGNIATPDSILILQRMLAGQSDTLRETAASACLLAADRRRANGDVGRALHLYDLIRTARVSIACRVGATRGAILARTADQVPFLMEQLRSPEPAIRNAALLTIREVPSDSLASALNQEATRVTGERQQLILMAMADCHNAQSLMVIQNLANSPAGEIRKAAWAVLGRIGPEAAPVLLGALQKDPAADEKSLILAGLRGANGSGVDDLLVSALAGTGSPGLRRELIRLLDERGVKKAARQLLALAGEPDRSVSMAALSALKSLADQQELVGLMALARSGADQEIRDAAAVALAGVCGRAGEPAAQTVLSALEQSTQPAERMVWMEVLAGIGYAKALPLLEAAAHDPDPALAQQALVQLGRWTNPAPMETLLKATETAARPALRNAALGSALELAGAAADDPTQSPDAVVPWLRRLNSCAQSLADQRRILGVLGRLKTAESFRLAASYLDRPELATEAASAVVQIAPALLSGADAAELQPALQKIGATVTNADLRHRAMELSKPRPQAAAAVSLFDGVSLAGWEGDTKVWRVRNGLIVGGSLQGNPRNEFLATTRSYTNFFLRLEYKLVGTEGFINSGVQFRSVRVANPPNEMNGYQADIGAGHSGCLYDESRRNTFLARCSDDTIKRLEKPGDWNRYELRCEGTHIQIWLNGEKTIDYAEPDPGIPQSGLIGLQIHGGNKAEVSFRNITLQEL